MSAGFRRFGSGATVIAALVATEVYVGYNQAFDYSTFMIGVIIPLAVGWALLRRRDNRFLLFAFVGYLWSVIDDAPVNFDSVLTWPEVTRLNPLLPHLTLELLLHLATLVFLYLSVWEISDGALHLHDGRLWIYMLLGIAFILSYFQNIPLHSVQSAVRSSWYELDVLEHLASVLVFGLALFGAKNLCSPRRQVPPAYSPAEPIESFIVSSKAQS
ncbi:MAG: hypothetical protein OK438_00810 [Thaumarchaeota archaeon]|nr:hypothetical protein [Nitrososphaerota archaeon]